MPRPLQVVTKQSPRAMELCTLCTNRPLDINDHEKHKSCGAPNFPLPGKRLTFRPLSGVTGHPCHGLSTCQSSASCTIFHSRLRVRYETDRQTDRQRSSVHYAHLWGGRIITYHLTVRIFQFACL